MIDLLKPRKPLYLASYTVRDGTVTCDSCPFHVSVPDVLLMHTHMDRHINGGWTGK